MAVAKCVSSWLNGQLPSVLVLGDATSLSASATTSSSDAKVSSRRPGTVLVSTDIEAGSNVPQMDSLQSHILIG